MADNVIYYRPEREKRRRSRHVERRKRLAKIVAILFVAAIIILVAGVLHDSRCDYYNSKVVSEEEDNGGVSYVAYADGLIKYSTGGIEYQKKFGRSVWNESISFQHPYVVTSDKYVLLIDKGANAVMLFDEKGKIYSESLDHPIIQAAVSNQGLADLLLKGDETNYISVRNTNWKEVIRSQTSLDSTGYPLATAISPDGTMLAVSYYTIDNSTPKTTVAFYDLSKQVQNNNEANFTAAFEYENSTIPRLLFTKNKKLMAIGDNAIIYFNATDTPSEAKKIDLDEEIISVIHNKKYTGIIFDHSNDNTEGDYRLCIYNQNGKRTVNTLLDMSYDDISMWDSQIIAYRSNECTILNLNGKILYQGTLDGDLIETIVPANSWRRSYYVIFTQKIEKMHLVFWK